VLFWVVDALDAPLDKQAVGEEAGPITVPPQSNTEPAEFKAMVRRAKEYIAAGDIFQVVLSQRFEAPFALPPFSLYRALRRVNPAPFLYFLDYGGFAIAGSSPEVLVRLRGSIVTIPPLAGTRPRGATRPTRTRRSRTNCSPTRRSAPSISCCSTSAATTSVESPPSVPST
jgi:anthranilate synthase component I